MRQQGRIFINVLFFFFFSVCIAVADWVPVNGTVLFNDAPVCALVLANGQHMFSCSEDGSFSMTAPTDANGNITLFGFVSGLPPFQQTLTSAEAVAFTINMGAEASDNALTVDYTATAGATSGWVEIEGTVDWNGTPVCGLILANGQHMFSCNEDIGTFSLEVPLDANDEITLFAFASGFQPYTEIIDGSALTDPPTTTSQQLQSSDFVYQGAFRLPYDFNWGARGMTYYPQGNNNAGSLFILGPDQDKAFCSQVSIPTPMVTSDWQTLPESTILSPLVDCGVALANSVSEETAWASGLTYIPSGEGQDGYLCLSLDNWYGVSEESYRTVWTVALDGSNHQGLYHVGPESDTTNFHGNRAGDFLFAVPQWYANQYLGGRTLITGKTRGAFDGSQGPSMQAFTPPTRPNSSTELDALNVLYYRLYDNCASPNVTNKSECDYPEFTFCDRWIGGAFIESGDRRAIMLFGRKGLGDNYYGHEPPAEEPCNGQNRGYHCDPYERQIIFYDVDELGAAAQGEVSPWTVTPYAIWRPQEFFLGDGAGQTCGETGGVAYDTTQNRVFMIEKGLGDGDNAAVVHVWTLSP